MKLFSNMKSAAIPLVAAAFLFSCAEQEITPEKAKDGSEVTLHQSDNTTASNARHDGHEGWIVLLPTGDASGESDPAILEDALHALTPGGTIVLTTGDYYLNRPVRAPEGFGGRLRGQGKTNTRLIGVASEASPFPLTLIKDGIPPVDINRPVLLHFPNPSGQLVVERMAMTLQSGFYTEDQVGDFFGPNDLYAFITVNSGNDPVNTTFRRLHLSGIDGNDTGPTIDGLKYQPAEGIIITGDCSSFPIPESGGAHKVNDNMFNNIGLQAVVMQIFDRARLEVKRNSFTDIKQVIARVLTNSQVNISNNNIIGESLGSIVVTQELYDVGEGMNRVFINHNDIVNDGFMGIEIGEAPNFKCVITNNHITVGPDPNGFFDNITGIGIFPGSERALVLNNTVLGESEFTISLFGVGKSLVVLNEVSGHSPYDSNYLLDVDTFNNLVINLGSSTYLDDGIGNMIINIFPGSRSNEDIEQLMQAHRDKYGI